METERPHCCMYLSPRVRKHQISVPPPAAPPPLLPPLERLALSSDRRRRLELAREREGEPCCACACVRGCICACPLPGAEEAVRLTNPFAEKGALRTAPPPPCISRLALAVRCRSCAPAFPCPPPPCMSVTPTPSCLSRPSSRCDGFPPPLPTAPTAPAAPVPAIRTP